MSLSLYLHWFSRFFMSCLIKFNVLGFTRDCWVECLICKLDTSVPVDYYFHFFTSELFSDVVKFPLSSKACFACSSHVNGIPTNFQVLHGQHLSRRSRLSLQPRSVLVQQGHVALQVLQSRHLCLWQQLQVRVNWIIWFARSVGSIIALDW